MKSPDYNFAMPDLLNIKTKPSMFCPGCGESIILKHLGIALKDNHLQNKTTFIIDIGCALLSWNYFNLDTLQSHHGRSIPVATGYKMVRKSRNVIAFMGDGGAYAIGLQSLLHAAFRNNPITVIVVNNTDYAMTGGQMAPTTLSNEITTTSVSGKDPKEVGPAFHGPELVRQIANKNAFIARASVSNPTMLDTILTKAFKTQSENNFSMVEVLSICPTNWKMSAMESFDFLAKMEKVYPVGEIIQNEKPGK